MCRQRRHQAARLGMVYKQEEITRSYQRHIHIVNGLTLQQAQRERRFGQVPKPRRALAVSRQRRVAAGFVDVHANCCFLRGAETRPTGCRATFCKHHTRYVMIGRLRLVCKDATDMATGRGGGGRWYLGTHG